LFDQVGARNQFWPCRRDEELCKQHWDGHYETISYNLRNP
jgi:hypothetical protein